MGESQQEQLSLGFDAGVRLEFVGSKITSDAGLVAHRELDEKLGLTEMSGQFLTEQRSGRNVQHHLVPLIRQSVYSRLAGYPDTGAAEGDGALEPDESSREAGEDRGQADPSPPAAASTGRRLLWTGLRPR